MTVVLDRQPDWDVAKMVNLATMCRMHGCLPGPGGALDQDYYYMLGMAYVHAAWEERREMERKRKDAQRRHRRR